VGADIIRPFDEFICLYLVFDVMNDIFIVCKGEPCSPAGERGSPQQCGTKNYDITLGHNMCF
ncbi:hypothetical protein, partial [Ruminococcus bromii]|uniref:hypothetical protein n=1 Tax=Ruminococcus bromii TaxID=40518 RepID=UPI00241C889F